MKKYYTRVCNFYYGNISKKLVKQKKTLPLNGSAEISFDHIEILSRNSKKKIKSEVDVVKKVQSLEGKESSINENKTTVFDGDWKRLVNNLKIGLAKSLAQECSLLNYEDHIFNLILNEKFQHLNQDSYIDKLAETLSNYFNKKTKVNITLGKETINP